MKERTALDLVLLSAVVWVGWKLFGKGGVEDQATSAIASLWLKMFPLPPAIELLGNVKFPGNILVPLQQLSDAGAVRQADNGDVYVRYAGYYWKLAPQQYGNWPATRVD